MLRTVVRHLGNVLQHSTVVLLENCCLTFSILYYITFFWKLGSGARPLNSFNEGKERREVSHVSTTTPSPFLPFVSPVVAVLFAKTVASKKKKGEKEEEEEEEHSFSSPGVVNKEGTRGEGRDKYYISHKIFGPLLSPSFGLNCP